MNIKSPVPGNDVGYKKERQRRARVQEHVCMCARIHASSTLKKIKKIKKKKGAKRRRLGRLHRNAALLVVVSKQQVNQTKQLDGSC